MRPEHVRISALEKNNGHKKLLYSQMEIITALQHCEKYRRVRAEEMMLKISLKNKIEETLLSLQHLQKLLPKPVIMPEKSIEIREVIKKEKISLEEEIEIIRRKLSQLRYE